MDGSIQLLSLRLRAVRGLYLEQCKKDETTKMSGDAVVSVFRGYRNALSRLDQKLDALGDCFFAMEASSSGLNNECENKAQSLISIDKKLEDDIAKLRNHAASSVVPSRRYSVRHCSSCYCNAQVDGTATPFIINAIPERPRPGSPLKFTPTLPRERIASHTHQVLSSPFCPASGPSPMSSRSVQLRSGSASIQEYPSYPLRPFSTARILPQSRRRRVRQNCKKLPTLIPPISTADFLAVPPHLRQRLTVEKINAAIDAINDFAFKKYTNTRGTHRKSAGTSLRTSSPITSRSHISQPCEDTEATRDTFWFSESDVRLFEQPSFKMDASGKSILTVLRTLQRLIRLPGGGPVIYCLPEKPPF